MCLPGQVEKKSIFDARLTVSKQFAKVAVPVHKNSLFDYMIPNDLVQHIQIGSRVQVPFMNKQFVGVVVAFEAKSACEIRKIRAITTVLDPEPLLNDLSLGLCQWASRYYHYPIGPIVLMTLPRKLRQISKKNPAEKVVYYEFVGIQNNSEHSFLNNKPKQKKLLHLLSNQLQPFFSRAALNTLGVTANFLKKFVAAGWLVEASEKKLLISLSADMPVLSTENNPLKETPLVLNTAQRICFEQIQSDLNTFKIFLLEGVTGSGKTELYLQLIANIVQLKKQSLVLIPEINLTPQTIQRFEKRFSVPTVYLHSGLSDTKRLAHWRLVQSGAAQIIIGTRSALWCPFKNLGLIVVDESHDAAFRQQKLFRYSARDLAIVLAKKAVCPIILGTATPSLESLLKVQQGHYTHLQLMQRARAKSLPDIKIIDNRRQTITAGLSQHLCHEINETLKKKLQVILFINRRGFAPVYLCDKCGWYAVCDRCDAKMTYHQTPNFLQCHLCLKRSVVPQHCPDCKMKDTLQRVGFGTQRLESALQSLFPNYPIIRMDRDELPTQQHLDRVLQKIHSQLPMVLIGTQLIAKGHDFSNVGLVGIIDIDSAFYSGEFRAIEQMAQLIVQVAGRSGRDKKRGQVLLQTYYPENTYLQPLLQHDYAQLAQLLLEERSRYALPPFYFLAVIRAEAQKTERVCHFLKQILKNKLHSSSVEIIGPIPLTRPKRAGHFRGELIFRSHSRKQLHHDLGYYLERIDSKLQKTVRWHLEVDPLYIC